MTTYTQEEMDTAIEKTYNEVYEIGHQIGYGDGHEVGYDKGYKAAINETEV